MTRHFILLAILVFALSGKMLSQTSYACFENDKNKNLKISVSFDKNKRAMYVKYSGQKDSIRIFYSKIVKSENDGIPAVYWVETYLEKSKGKITGEYTFTNAGTFQLDVYYRRKKDNKEFYFSIIESTAGDDDPPFQFKTCF